MLYECFSFKEHTSLYFLLHSLHSIYVVQECDFILLDTRISKLGTFSIQSHTYLRFFDNSLTQKVFTKERNIGGGSKFELDREGRNGEPMSAMRTRLRRPQAFLGGNRFRLNGVIPPLSLAFLLLSSVSSVKDTLNQVSRLPKF